MTEETKLMPCPFCGSEVAQLNTNQFHCENAACVLAGFPICSTAGHARRLWNERALSPPEPTEGQVEKVARALDKCCGRNPDELIDGCPSWIRRKTEANAVLRAMPLQDHGEWKPGTTLPDVKRGREKELIVAVRRAHSGKVYSFASTYLNAYPLEYRDGCPKGDGCEGRGCDDGCPTTGWFIQTGEDGDGTQYHSLDLKEGDELLGWRDVPQWLDAPVIIAEQGTK